MTWQRLDRRVVWVDLVRSVLSLVPTVVAVGLFGVEPRLPDLWPAVAVAVLGVGGAVADLLRWLKTRYRITPERVELRTGLLVTTVRDVPRDRVRSVDASAKLLHRMAGLRKVSVGVGGGEPALVLDAVSVATAADLRRSLSTGATPVTRPDDGARADEGTALARFAWPWLVHNLFGVWVYLGAAGVLWGAFWLLAGFGLRPMARLRDAADALGPVWTVVVGVAVLSAVGVVTMAASFLSENANFRLTRVDGSLRTTQGLFRTREVNRDVARVRGAEISEPLLWRWLGTADTSLVSTGLSVWSLRPTAAILPRGPVGTARRVVAEVLGRPVLDAPLTPHPPAALRRRLVWAVLLSVAVGAAGALWWTWLAGLLVAPLALGAAVVAYRSLGHAVVADHLVVRSGLVARRTVALDGRAVVGWQVRQSVFQRRLGLATLVAATAAGSGHYEAVDLPAADALAVAEATAPGLLTAFDPAGREKIGITVPS